VNGANRGGAPRDHPEDGAQVRERDLDLIDRLDLRGEPIALAFERRRGRDNVARRYLIQVAAHNLGLPDARFVRRRNPARR
jgi:hypothetical protein